ncbi:helix-turn-helix transcriptional regulator, partial [Streptomyces fuscigenes]|uniref:helix-turn-helix transcriptional regulator n=1 Tax=Streptomyces fuscigenes TaxID=1528880 RepID=UPI001F2C0202
PAAAPDARVLLDLAGAVRERHPVRIEYTDREGRRSTRTVHPYGLVAHRDRWYLTGADPAAGGTRVFRVDRIGGAAGEPGKFAVPAGFDPVGTVLDALARAPWTHDVVLRVRGTVDDVRGRFPADLAALSEIPPDRLPGPDGSGWVLVRLRAERLDWIPAVLAALDRPFAVERPAALRDLVRALARRLAEGAAGTDR